MEYNRFDFTKPSDFVENLRNMTDQRAWFSGTEAVWNIDESPEFVEIVTRHGLGFAFNLVEDSELLITNNTSEDFRFSYNDSRIMKKRPWSTGAQSESKLWTKFYFGNYYPETCELSKFSVHSPFELPEAFSFKPFDNGLKLNVWITPQIQQTDEDLRRFDPDDRRCYFDDERKLNYFKVYTQNNCQMECLSFVGEFSLHWFFEKFARNALQLTRTAAAFLST